MEPHSTGRTVRDEVRINELCRELGVKAKAILNYLPLIGVTEKKTHSSAITVLEAEKIRRHFTELKKGENEAASAPATVEPQPEAGKIILEAGLGSLASSSELGTARRAQSVPSLDIGLPAKSSVRPSSTEPVIIRLPRKFTFYRAYMDFDFILRHFDWTLRDVPVVLDLTDCISANYQALALLIQYLWLLSWKGCQVTIKYGVANSGPTKMLRDMGAVDWLQVLKTDGKQFGNWPGRTNALRRRSDVQNAINIARRAIQDYSLGFPEYLSYIVSELLYNATEHGSRRAVVDGCQIIVPSIFQFSRYPFTQRIAFLFADLGIGIKAHIERAYPPFPTHQEAIVYALRPNISGTFIQGPSSYGVKNNAGMGLTYSSRMLKRLKGNMYIISHNGQVHVSPEDVTTQTLDHVWPGTFVFFDLDISAAPQVSLEDLLGEVRGRAENELTDAEKREQANKFYVSIENHFGKWAEDKDAAISFRDRKLIPALEGGKKIELDFRDVETVPHSFLNALLATPIQRLGVRAYQWIHVFNASGSIHEIIHSIFEANLPKL